MCIPTRDEIRAAYRQGEEATIQLFDNLARELQTLQDQLNKNSKNSSKNPFQRWSQEAPHQKPEKAGQQKEWREEGHIGRTLEPVEEPDHIIVHTADQCDLCGATLIDVEAEDHKRTAGSLTFRP